LDSKMLRTNNHCHFNELAIAAKQNKKEREYWLGKLSGDIEKSRFPYDYRQTPEEPIIDTVQFDLSGELFVKLTGLSNKSDLRLHMILVSALVILLEKYTGRKDIIVGAPIYKQDCETRLINSVLVLRNELAGALNFKQVLLSVRETIVEASENYGYPVEIMIQDLNLESNNNDFPLFDVAILLGNIHDRIHIRHIPCNITFSFFRYDQVDKIEGTLEYNSLLYGKKTAEQIIHHFKRLLQQVLFNIHLEISRVDILSPKEKKSLLYDLNDTGTAFPKDKTIAKLFEEQVGKKPGKIAVLYKDKKLTYSELNKRANQLARLLIKKGVKANTIVGVLLERSLDMILALLAILKAGGAYLPIETDTPKNRIITMLEECNAPFLLTKTDIAGKHSFTALQGLKFVNSNLHLTSPRKQVRNLDNLPVVDRSLVNYEAYHKYIGQAMVKHSITLQATRGCPYQCAYCFKVWPEKHVFRSHENILEEVKLYYDMGVRRFVFIDDIFNFNRENSTKFFQSVIRDKLDIQLIFPSGFRGDILTKDHIDLVIEAGTVSFALALETASPRLQKLVRKNLQLERFREIIEYICEKYPQIILELQTMHGLPTETEEEAMMTLDFIKSIKWFDFPYVNILKIFPGTMMEKLALESGISREVINRSVGLSYHQLPDTLPFDKAFTLSYQANFLNEYFLCKERLLHVLPFQMKVLTEDEIVQKYNSYLPTEIASLTELLEFAGISPDELNADGCLDEKWAAVPGLNQKLAHHFPRVTPGKNRLNVLLLDLSIFFLDGPDMLYDVIESPLGLMYLLTYLREQYTGKMNGKIAKSRIDFNSYAELKRLLEEFQPDVIGVRSMTFYRDFFHKSITMIRQWGFDVPIIAGGPYATSNHASLLQDANIDLAVLGEGEITFAEIIGKILENKGKLPGESTLKEIDGIAFIPGEPGRWHQTGREVIMMDHTAEVVSKESTGNLSPANQPGDLVYTIFTSGSTGTPKGTFTTHTNVIRVVKDTNYIELLPGDRILQLSNYAFDGSVFDIYGALLNGAALVMIEKDKILALDELANLIRRERITVFFVTTALFNALVDFKIESFTKIRKVLFGGERVSVEHTRKALDHMGKNKILHMYGPTETTVYATYYPVNQIDDRLGTIPIGKPISNTTIYILDRKLLPVPVGVTGQVCIGGNGVAIGYLNNQELTSKKIIPDLFFQGESVYLSGDLGRWLPDGNIRFIGRIDQQVKIRGFRIELGEIEKRLRQIDFIKEAAVINRKNAEGETYLCAYVVPVNERTEAFDKGELRRLLSLDLPAYMVPDYFVAQEVLPLTPNGKIDWKVLPEPRRGKSGTDSGDGAPRDEVEQKLVDIWKEVLGIENIGIYDDFFEMGGHSLKALELINTIHKEFNTKIDFKSVFCNPTAAELGAVIRSSESPGLVQIEKQPEKPYYELSYSQERLWLIYKLDPTNLSYNMSGRIRFEEKVDAVLIKRVLATLIARHESFRTCFRQIDDRPVQVVLPEAALKLEEIDLTHLADEDKEKRRSKFLQDESLQPFNLEETPILRAKLIKWGDEGFDLVLALHHIIFDGWSMEIFEKEFHLLYESYKKGKPCNLEPLRIQYKDFAGWQNRLLSDQEKMGAAKEFWREQFMKCGRPPMVELPYDFSTKTLESRESAGYRAVVPSAVTGKLRALARERDASLFMVLLTGFYLFLARVSGQKDIVTAVPAAARQHENLKNIIGFFVNTLVLRNRIDSNESFNDFLARVQENTLQVFEYQSYPLELICGELKIKYPDISAFFNMSIFGGTQQQRLENLGAYHLEFVQEAKFNMVCFMMDYKNGIEIIIHYYKKRFKPGKIEKLMETYLKILEAISLDTGKVVRDYIKPGKRKTVKLA
jgi:amino acid adenylation domain-containing protein